MGANINFCLDWFNDIKVALGSKKHTTPTLRYAIIGLGASGLSCVRHLAAQSVPIAVMDTRPSPPGLADMQAHFPHVPVHVGGLDTQALLQADELIVSPGFPFQDGRLRRYQKPDTTLIGDIELFARAVGDNIPIIGITGSNGKSTVTTLLGEMAKAIGVRAKVGGNLGYPALDLLQPSDPDNIDLYILELSSFQLELTHSLRLAAGVVLNICDDHLDSYTSRHAYIAAKHRLYPFTKTAVINRDDPASFTATETTAALPDRLISFGLSHPATPKITPPTIAEWGITTHKGHDYLTRGQRPIFPVNDLFDCSDAQVANSLAALALGEALGWPLPPLLPVLSHFKGLPHRCEKVGVFSGVTWYNDSKATNVGAAIASITSVGRRLSPSQQLIVIAGGNAKDADFTPLAEPMARYVSTLILLGRDAQQLGHVIKASTDKQYVSTMSEAVSVATARTKPGDTVLLAPACSSLDGLFKNFEHRGEVFINAIREQHTNYNG